MKLNSHTALFRNRGFSISRKGNHGFYRSSAKRRKVSRVVYLSLSTIILGGCKTPCPKPLDSEKPNAPPTYYPFLNETYLSATPPQSAEEKILKGFEKGSLISLSSQIKNTNAVKIRVQALENIFECAQYAQVNYRGDLLDLLLPLQEEILPLLNEENEEIQVLSAIILCYMGPKNYFKLGETKTLPLLIKALDTKYPVWIQENAAEGLVSLSHFLREYYFDSRIGPLIDNFLREKGNLEEAISSSVNPKVFYHGSSILRQLEKIAPSG